VGLSPFTAATATVRPRCGEGRSSEGADDQPVIRKAWFVAIGIAGPDHIGCGKQASRLSRNLLANRAVCVFVLCRRFFVIVFLSGVHAEGDGQR